jgi:hypothetical protein
MQSTVGAACLRGTKFWRSAAIARLAAIALAAGGIAGASAHGLVAHADRTEATRPLATAPAPSADPAAREMTLQLLAMRDRQGQLKSSVDKAALTASMRELAEARADMLRDLVETDPAEVLRVALPAGARERLPADARPFVEEAVDATGEIEAFHVDHADGSLDHYLHFLVTPAGRYSLHYAGSTPDITTGAIARVRGVRVGDAIAVAGANSVSAEKMTAVPGTKGPQKTLAILVNFSDATSKPYTATQVASVMFGTTSNFDYEVSYQQTTLTGDVAGWYTVATTAAACDMFAIASQARQAAATAGYDLSKYARLVYIFPAASCSWWGMGSVGGSPSQAWVHTRWGLSVDIVAHEMGHNLGLWHAHALDCGTSAVASDDASCTKSEYGDVFDTMGGSKGHYNAFQKERLGWLGDGASPPLTIVPAVSGTSSYDIAPLEIAGNGTPRALKIPRTTACGANDEWFYVEARQATGADAFLSGNSNVLAGVLVRKVSEGDADSSFLLDMTPSTSSWNDAALAAGQSFTDPASGLRLQTVSAGGSGARVSVTFPAGACTRSAPAVSIAPSGTAWTAPGAPVTYTVQAQNRDGCGCAPSAFDLAASLPSGWQATAARTGTTAPGGIASASIVVTPAAGASPAFYPVTFKATNASATAYAASVAGTVAIDGSAVPPPPPPSAAPALTVTTDQGSYGVPRTGKVIPIVASKVTRSGAAVAGASVAVEVRNPKGKVTKVSAVTGSDGVAKVSLSFDRTAKTGTYSVTSRASVGTASATGTTSFVLR